MYQEECSSANLHIVAVDLTDWEATRFTTQGRYYCLNCQESTNRSALSPLPRMDGLVNNAAVAICTPFLEVTPGEIDL